MIKIALSKELGNQGKRLSKTIEMYRRCSSLKCFTSREKLLQTENMYYGPIQTTLYTYHETV